MIPFGAKNPSCGQLGNQVQVGEVIQILVGEGKQVGATLKTKQNWILLPRQNWFWIPFLDRIVLLPLPNFLGFMYSI